MTSTGRTPAYPDISRFSAERVWDGAVALLRDVGLRVANRKLLEAARRSFAVRGDMVHFPPDAVMAYAERLRVGSKAAASAEPDTAPGLGLYNSGVHFRYLDAATGEVRPFTMAALLEHSRFIYQLGAEGLYQGSTPGYPIDVPPQMQFLAAYYVEALLNPHPGCQSLSSSARAMQYIIEMSRILGVGQWFCVEPISPMSLVGPSVDTVAELYEPGMGAGVDPMPIMGITAPLDWHAAWSQSVAENLGACLLLEAAGIQQTSPSFRLFVPDMATGMIWFTSPRHLAALLTRREVRRFFGMPTDSGELLLVASKRPDGQAAAEKMAGCLLGALYGFRHLEGAGALDLDILFSAQQLMIDLEVRDYVRHMGTGLEAEELDIVSAVREGVAAGSFLQTDHTLAVFRDFSWHRRLFDRAGGGEPPEPLLARASAVNVAEKAALYGYELADERREQIERLMARARREFAA